MRLGRLRAAPGRGRGGVQCVDDAPAVAAGVVRVVMCSRRGVRLGLSRSDVSSTLQQ